MQSTLGRIPLGHYVRDLENTDAPLKTTRTSRSQDTSQNFTKAPPMAWIIEAILSNLPRAERIKCLNERETFWIYTLDCLKPGGLNETETHSIL